MPTSTFGATTNISMWHNVLRRGPAPLPSVLLGPHPSPQRCNHTKWSVLRYPNDAMAQLAGVSTEGMRDFYFKACLVDYEKMGRAMEHLEALMDKTDRVHIVSPARTSPSPSRGSPATGCTATATFPTVRSTPRR